MGSRRRRARRDRREARRAQSLGVRRPALLGRRGRRLHQLLHARLRRVARRRRLGARGLVPGPPARRRRLELRGRGGRLDALVVPLHPQRGARHPRVRAHHRRHRTARGPPRRRGVPAQPPAAVPGDDRRAGRRFRRRGSSTRTATGTARSLRSTTSATPRCPTARLRIRGSPTRSTWCAPRGSRTARGCRRRRSPGGRGSTSTPRRASRRAG